MSDESGNKQRILIVDDSKVIRVTARKILQDHFATVEAVNGENAWEILTSEEPFSVIVSDLTMPELDGYGLLERIRGSHLPHIQNIPVIVITGSNDSKTVKERAATAGATDFIGKPFDSVDLLARTQAHASAHATATTLKEETIALEEQITTDHLTGLVNETAFMDHGYQLLSYAIRHKTGLAVFRIEIDDFDSLFKQHNQAVSESIIKSVAKVLQANIRQEDIAARIGTARFSLLLPAMNRTGISNLADRISRDISARTLKQGETRIRYTVSIGVAAPEILRNTRFEELLSVADSRLVYGTSTGGDQVILDDTGNEAPYPVPQDPCMEEEPVSVAPEETVCVTTGPAVSELRLEEMVAPEAEEAPGETAEQTAPTDAESAAVECRIAPEADNQPAVYAGPVPDMAADSVNNTESASDGAPGSKAPNAPAWTLEEIEDEQAEEIEDKKAIDIPQLDETIVIGVPGNDFLPYEHMTESANPHATPDENTAAAETDSADVKNTDIH